MTIEHPHASPFATYDAPSCRRLGFCCWPHSYSLLCHAKSGPSLAFIWSYPHLFCTNRQRVNLLAYLLARIRLASIEDSMSFSGLPDGCLQVVLDQLSIHDVAACAATCKRISLLAQLPLMWLPRLKADFGVVIKVSQSYSRSSRAVSE